MMDRGISNIGVVAIEDNAEISCVKRLSASARCGRSDIDVYPVFSALYTTGRLVHRKYMLTSRNFCSKKRHNNSGDK